MADFDLPVEDFEALQSIVQAGDLPAAEKRFRELTGVSVEDAQFFVQEMAAGNSDVKSISEQQDAKVAGSGSVPEPEPVYTSIPLPVSKPRSDVAAPRPVVPVPRPAAADMPLPAASKRVPAASRPSPEVAEPSRPAPAPSAPAPVKPPAAKAVMTTPIRGSAAELDTERQLRVSADGRLLWYERVLPAFSIPLLWGGLLGGVFCALGFAVTLMILKSSLRHRGGRYLSAILALAGSYAGYLTVAGEVPREFSLLSDKWELSKPDPIEPSSTHDWKSQVGSGSAEADSELQTVLSLSYRPPQAFPPVSTAIENSNLTLMSEDAKVDGALVGVPMLEKKRDLVADFGKGSKVNLVNYAVRFPWDRAGAPQQSIDQGDSGLQTANETSDTPMVRHRQRPVLRCTVSFNRMSSEDLLFHLFDAQSGRKVSSAKSTAAGAVDFELGIWHETPLLMVVEGNAWTSSSSWRRPLPVGEDFVLGLGRIQVAYVGAGRLDGVANGATIECGQSYRLVDAEKQGLGGMVIARYAPPYLAESTSLLMVATSDHLVSAIPAFGEFEFEPVGPDGDGLGFRVFHIPPTIDDRLQGEGLGPGKSRAETPPVERAVNFEFDRLSVSFGNQRGRGLIAMGGVTGLLSIPESNNLFDVTIPLITFQEKDSLRLLLELAADAVEFDLETVDEKLKLRDFKEPVEYRDLSPRQALLNFEQLSGIRVIVDSDQRRIRLQP